MAELRVTCTNRIDPGTLHEHITHIGGSGWKKTRQDAVREIEGGTNVFYVIDPKNSKRADVRVFTLNGTKYLRTSPDNDKNDNLLVLPKCP